MSCPHFDQLESCCQELILEQLEERIVLDGAVDDVSCRSDFFSAQALEQGSGDDNALDDCGISCDVGELPSLALETGSETLPDGTWHYWQRDWAANGNGYEFHAWQDGSSSFHQIQWDTATNSRGTHNGFDYNLQRNGSWSYQAVQWDASQNGSSYNATSAGAYSYEAHQWSNGMGYDYASDSNGTWTYRAIQPGQAAGDKLEYASDWKGYWNYTYTWANGVTWSDGSANYAFEVSDGFVLWGSLYGLTDVNGTLYFWANDGVHGYELWKSNGTDAGTVMVRDIELGSGHSMPMEGGPHLINVNGTLYFNAYDDSHGTELWKVDGTAAGAVMVKDIYPGSGSSLWFLDGFVGVNGEVYFAADDLSHGSELWKSNGTAIGTVMVKDIDPGKESGCPNNITNVNGTLFFWTDDASHGFELWKSDGTATNTILLKDIRPGAAGSVSWDDLDGNVSLDKVYPTNVNGTLYFVANNGSHGAELWKTNGTESGTVMVKDIFPGSNGSHPMYLTNVNGTLYFYCSDGVHGAELWKSDGTAAGTVMVKDIVSGASGCGIYELCGVNGVLYFSCDDDVHGIELWKSDGTAAGTVIVKDMWIDGSPGGLTNVNGVLYFVADNIPNGRALWKSDGTTLGTVEVVPGDIGDLTYVNGTLYFWDSSQQSSSIALWAVRVASA